LCIQQLATKPHGCASIPSGLHQNVDHVSILVARPPQLLVSALNTDEQLVQMPGVTLPSPPEPKPSIVVGPEGQAPLSDCLVGNRNPSLCEKILPVPKIETESVVQPNGMTDDLGREPVSSVARLTDTVPSPPSS